MCVVQSGSGLVKRCRRRRLLRGCRSGVVCGAECGDVVCWLYEGGEVVDAGEIGGAL